MPGDVMIVRLGSRIGLWGDGGPNLHQLRQKVLVVLGATRRRMHIDHCYRYPSDVTLQV